jgi:uncharacterized damage-inducible protein DinB
MTASTTPTDAATTHERSQERRDLVQTLAAHRGFLRKTARHLTDEQADTRSTVSELTIGGLIKHVTQVEGTWARFVLEGPTAHQHAADIDWTDYANTFRMSEGQTLAGLLAAYDEVAARTDELVRTVDLDAGHPLPEAPWFPKDSWSARRTFLHIIAETAQHAGHADIIREAIDGAKSMG